MIARTCIKLLLSVLVVHQISCDSQGHGGISSNINEARNRNVFIKEYEVVPNPYTVNDTLQIKVKSAWVENQWSYGKSEDISIIDRLKYQLVIEVEPGSLKDYGYSWTIGISGDRYIRRCGKDCLVTDFEYLPEDEEVWDVQSGWELDSLSVKPIIGKFKIHIKSL